MSTKIDKLGKPVLEDYDDPNMRYENVVVPNCASSAAYSGKSKRDRNTDLPGTMEMIDILLRQYECNYRSHNIDKSLLCFPYLFLKPEDGAKIRNKTTGEIYTVVETVMNPRTKNWEGLVKLSQSSSYPNRNRVEKLEFLNEDAYVRFTSEDPKNLGVESQDDEGLIIDKGPIRPTVVHSLIRKLPGTIGTRPFAPGKQYKPDLIETLRSDDNPNHTVEVYGNRFDNLVQFDCWTTDNFSADKLADWFEKFMSLYGGVLKLNWSSGGSFLGTPERCISYEVETRSQK